MAIADDIHPHNGCSQKEILKHIKEKENIAGVCRSFTINWLIESLNNAGKFDKIFKKPLTPAATLSEMMRYGPTYFKLISHGQSSYEKHYNDAEGNPNNMTWFESVHACINLGSYKKYSFTKSVKNGLEANSAKFLYSAVTFAIDKSSTMPPACLIGFDCLVNGKASGHAIAAIQNIDTIWYVFDPNYGVMIVNPGQSLESLISDIWKDYNITLALIGSVL